MKLIYEFNLRNTLTLKQKVLLSLSFIPDRRRDSVEEEPEVEQGKVVGEADHGERGHDEEEAAERRGFFLAGRDSPHVAALHGGHHEADEEEHLAL